MELVNVTLDSPQRKGRRFVNPWPGIEQHGFSDVLKWMSRRRAERRSEAPFELQAVSPAFIAPRAAPHQLTATWIGHTSTLLQLGGLNILTDPIWSKRASPLPFAGPRRFSPPGLAFDSLPVIDAIVISHDHYDHLDERTTRLLVSRFPAAAWRAPLGVGKFLRSAGARDVEEMTWHQRARLENIELTCVPAQHFSGRSPFNRDHTLWCGWVLSSEVHSVYFAGDTALNPSFAQIGSHYGPFDLALMPIGAYDPRWFMRSVHMDPGECVQAAAMLASRPEHLPVVLATHWGTFKLTDEPLDEPPARMRRAWSGAGFDAERLWIPRLGETRTF